MVIRLTICLVFAWAFTGLLYVGLTVAGKGAEPPVILLYSFYCMAVTSLLFTVYYLVATSLAYVSTGDGYAYEVIRIFQILSVLALAGALLTFVLKAERLMVR